MFWSLGQVPGALEAEAPVSEVPNPQTGPRWDRLQLRPHDPEMRCLYTSDKNLNNEQVQQFWSGLRLWCIQIIPMHFSLCASGYCLKKQSVNVPGHTGNLLSLDLQQDLSVLLKTLSRPHSVRFFSQFFINMEYLCVLLFSWNTNYPLSETFRHMFILQSFT